MPSFLKASCLDSILKVTPSKKIIEKQHLPWLSYVHLKCHLNGWTSFQNLLWKYKWMTNIRKNSGTMKAMKKRNVIVILCLAVCRQETDFSWLCFGTLGACGRKSLLLTSWPIELCYVPLSGFVRDLECGDQWRETVSIETIWDCSFHLWLSSTFLSSHLWTIQIVQVLSV